MQIKLKAEIIKRFPRNHRKDFDINESQLDWRGTCDIDIEAMPLNKVKLLKKILVPLSDIRGTKTLVISLENWIDVCEGKEPKIKRLRNFDGALISYLMEGGHRVYRKHSEHDVWVAHRVTEIRYHPEYRERENYYPAHVTMEYVHDKFGERYNQSATFYAEDVVRKTVKESLMRKGWFKETKELRENYLKELERYRKLIPLIGKQFLGNGFGEDNAPSEGDSYHSHVVTSQDSFRFTGEDKLLIDVFREDDKEWEKHHVDLGAYFWSSRIKAGDLRDEKVVKKLDKKRDSNLDFQDDEPDDLEIEDEDEYENVVEVPIHPFLIVFDLSRHLRLSCHVNYLTEYKYDKKLSEKLVLNDELKELVRILIKHKEGGFVDIIKNKTGGTIILLCGQAGTGKTLTAEVFAEASERPLYSIQASQLGIEPEDLEKALRKLLKRAQRWNAIMLIDEADVYVHERGNDINQNAIVGVFLRVLEYHTAMMFLTTNRPDIVDDAIASRCIARIDYKYPTQQQQKQIWRILADQSGIKISDEAISDFVSKKNDYSGRDIKNILKLSNLRSISSDKEITSEMIEYVSQFNPTLVRKNSGSN